MIVRCAGCHSPIQDRFLLTVLDKTWHSGCVLCCVCGCHLSEKCFSREGKLFCRDDFIRIFGTKCAGCDQVILPHDLVRRARDRIYHVTCFLCGVCKRQLSTGEQLYVISDRHLVCSRDYFKIAEEDNAGGDACGDDAGERLDNPTQDDPSNRIVTSLPEGSHFEFWNKMEEGYVGGQQDLPSRTVKHGGPEEISLDEDYEEGLSASGEDSPPSSPGMPRDRQQGKEGYQVTSGMDVGVIKDDRKGEEVNQLNQGEGNASSGGKRRGPRTTIKAKQLETLKNAFTNTPKPTRHIREQLAQETGLNMRVIQVWFQNRRSKERRMKQFNAQGLRRNFFRTPRRVQRGSIPLTSLHSLPNILGEHHPLFLRDFFLKSEGMNQEYLPCSHPCSALQGCFPHTQDVTEFYNNSKLFGNTDLVYPDFYSSIGMKHSSHATNQMQGLMHPLSNQRIVAPTTSSMASSNQTTNSESASAPTGSGHSPAANSELLNHLAPPSQEFLQISEGHELLTDQSQMGASSIRLDLDQSETGLGGQFLGMPPGYDPFYDMDPIVVSPSKSSSSSSSPSSSSSSTPSSSSLSSSLTSSSSSLFIFGDNSFNSTNQQQQQRHLLHPHQTNNISNNNNNTNNNNKIPTPIVILPNLLHTP